MKVAAEQTNVTAMIIVCVGAGLMAGGCASSRSSMPTTTTTPAVVNDPNPRTHDVSHHTAPPSITEPAVTPTTEDIAAPSLPDGPVMEMSSQTGLAVTTTTENDLPWEVGLASYYGNAFVGRRTASGERYRHSFDTCAHRTAPFGSILEVERNDTGERVRCRVNDRGPFIEGRVIDVSQSVARKLGILHHGLVSVRVRVVTAE